MIKTMVELNGYFQTRISALYSRANLDAFLKAYPLHFKVPAIHLTGTNGKGSTATFLRNMYQTKFKKVGLFTSPALSRFQEMIYINQEEISDDYILAFFEHWQVRFEQYQLTAFEMQTLLALHYFQDQHCDFAIIEVGMGGKIDATNIFTPVLSIITNISLEHKAYLGDTVAKIAEHKSGIIKLNVPVLVGPLPPSAMAVVSHVANEHHAPISQRGPYQILSHQPLTFAYGDVTDYQLSMTADYQVENATLALAATNILQSRFPLNPTLIKRAMYETFMPGRLEVVKQSPLVIIDGAHNPGGAQALVQAITHHAHAPMILLFAAFKDKDVTPMLETLSTISKRIVLTTFPHPRARKKQDYIDAKYPFIESYQEAIRLLGESLPPHGVLLITGSLAFAGLVRQMYVPTFKTTRS
jgi:dihydrofolate synthase / folylpolyglutamate synthase